MSRRSRAALVTAVLAAAAALAGCTSTAPAAPAVRRRATGTPPPPARSRCSAADDACEVGTGEAAAGTITFAINNAGTKVTEFYLYGTGDRIMGEVENIGPGLTRQLIVEVPDGGTYTTACKPGMVGDGIRAPFTVTGQRRPVGRREHQARRGHRRLQALLDLADRGAGAQDPGVRRRGQGRQGRPGQGDVPGRPHLLGADRAGRRVVRRHRPEDRRPGGRRARARRRSSPASTGWRRTCGWTACSPTRRPSPTS